VWSSKCLNGSFSGKRLTQLLWLFLILAFWVVRFNLTVILSTKTRTLALRVFGGLFPNF